MSENILKIRWSSKDIQILEKIWFKTSKIEIETILPNRTWYSISAKANRMGFKRESIGKNIDGTFKQKRKLFSLDNFNDGYVDNKERFRVWCPEHHRAYKNGYILRAIVAYELYHKAKVFKEKVIHHKDGDKMNDSKENLEMFMRGKHTILHNFISDSHLIKTCENCGEKFKIDRSRFDKTHKGRFCSKKCYLTFPRSTQHKENISKGMLRAVSEGRH